MRAYTRTILDLKTKLDPVEWQRVIVLGSGISLLNLPKSAVPRFTTIALNGAIEYAGATVHFWADQGLTTGYSVLPPDRCKYIVTSHDEARDLERKPGFPSAEKVYGFTKVVQGDMHLCSPDNDTLWVCQTCATAAIMFATKMGAREIYLVGVDSYKLEYRHFKRGHYFANYFSDPIESGGMFLRNPCHALMSTEIDVQLKWVNDTWPNPPTVYQTNPQGGTQFTPFKSIGELLDNASGSPIQGCNPKAESGAVLSENERTD